MFILTTCIPLYGEFYIFLSCYVAIYHFCEWSLFLKASHITLNLQPTIINFSCLVVLWASRVFEYYSTKGATHAA